MQPFSPLPLIPPWSKPLSSLSGVTSLALRRCPCFCPYPLPSSLFPEQVIPLLCSRPSLASLSSGLQRPCFHFGFPPAVVSSAPVTLASSDCQACFCLGAFALAVAVHGTLFLRWPHGLLPYLLQVGEVLSP